MLRRGFKLTLSKPPFKGDLIPANPANFTFWFLRHESHVCVALLKCHPEMRCTFADQVLKCRTSPVPLAAGVVKTFLQDGSNCNPSTTTVPQFGSWILDIPQQLQKLPADRQIVGGRVKRIPSLKLTYIPKGKDRIPTIHFQGQCHVSFREGRIWDLSLRRMHQGQISNGKI